LRAAVSVLAIAAVAAAGCGGGGGSEKPAASSLFVQLQEQNYSGQSGTANLTAEGGKTRVAIELSSQAAGAQPAYILKGTCSSRVPTPAFRLNDVRNGKSTTIVDASLSSLKHTDYAITVHSNAKHLGTYVEPLAACADIAENAAPAPTWTTSD
jgi:hypothetical protein